MPRILIVDDEKENREALKRALGDENPSWEIFMAKSDAEARKVIDRGISAGKPMDVLLTDLVMKTDRSGIDCLKFAKTKDPDLMAILFTAKEKSLDRYSAFEVGAFDVVEKNILGAAAYKELNVKTRAALKFREAARRMAFLRRYFDPKLFESIEKDPNALILKSRTVTICFWDIRGFSSLCETLKANPDLISGFLKDYCEAAAKAVLQHGGVVDKFIGDGVMALFGALGPASEASNDDAIAACRAALTFRDQFNEIAEKWMSQWKLYTPQVVSVGVGCGIHTGEALVGNVGTEFRDQFTALGPHVNFAARIEGRSAGGQIILSQSARQRVRNSMTCKAVGEMDNIKNIPGRYELFELVAGQE